MNNNPINQTTFIVLIASTFTVMAGSAIAPVLPDALSAFAGQPDAELKVRMAIGLSAFFTMLGSALLGGLSDRLGYLTTIKLGLGIIIISALVGIFADTVNQFLLSRCILGVGVSATAIGSTAWIGQTHEGPMQHRITGYLGTAMETSGFIYFLLAGALSLLHWRAVFLIYLLPVFALLLLFNIKDPVTKQLIDETKSSEWLRQAIIYLASFLALLGLNAYVTYIPFLFDSLEASAFSSGLALGGASICAGIASFLFPKILSNRRHHHVLILAFTISALGFSCLATANSVSSLSLALIICGFGFGLKIPSMIGWINVISQANNRGKYQARLAMAGFAGQFTGPLVNELSLFSIDERVLFISIAALSLFYSISLFIIMKHSSLNTTSIIQSGHGSKR